MNSIEELKSISTAAREKKGRMDAQARSRAVEVLAALWKDSGTDARQSLGYLESLHYEALAEGIGAAWGDMPPERRSIFQQWLPAPTTERDTRRMASVAASIIEKDGHTALDWLDRIIGSDKGRLNREVRHILATTVLVAKGGRLRNMADDSAHPEKTLRVFSALLQVASNKEEKVALGKRCEIVDAMLRLLSDRKVQIQGGAAEIQDRIASEIQSWPSELKEQFRHQATGIEPTLLDRFFNSGSTVRSVPEVPRTPSTPTPAPTTINQKAALDALDGRIAELRRELDTLAAVRKMLQDLETATLAAEEERKHAVAEQGRLRLELDESIDNSLRLNDKAIELASQLANLQKEVDKVRTNAETQRTDLLHQIEANSRGRIDEFKTSLGLTLSKLAQDLPSQNKELSPAAARVLLLQFHQFLEMLEEKGIRVRPARGTGA
jgi:hypothetical protein